MAKRNLGRLLSGRNPEDLPRSRREAIASNEKHYFTGKPCKHRHLSPRSTDGTCLECHRIKASRYYKENPAPAIARVLARTARRKIEEPEAVRAEWRRNEQAWRAANPERANEQSREWYQANIEKAREQQRARYAANSVALCEIGKRCREARTEIDPGWVARQHREWRRNNPEKAAANDKNKRARRKGAEGRHTAEEFQSVVKRQKGKCLYCKCKLTKLNTTEDHWKAITKGGSNYIQNIVAACNRCNSKKKNRDPHEFMRTLGFLL